MKARLFILSCLCLALSACGPDKPTPYDEYQARRLDRMAISVITFNATLLDANGKGVGGTTVTVSSPRYTEDAHVANDGHFAALAKFSGDDPIDFHFSGSNLDWTASLVKVPPGVETLKLRFLLERSGVIRLAALEY